MKRPGQWAWRRGARGGRGDPASSGFSDSVLGQAAPAARRESRRATRYAWIGAVIGGAFGLVAFAPAHWLAGALASGTGGRLLLTEAAGTVWQGSAQVVLTGGAGSRDAMALPGRLQWTIGLQGLALAVRAQQACCLEGEVQAQVRPGLGRVTVSLPARPAGFAQWPAAWLGGLGTPWNTLQLGGVARLSTSGANIEVVQGRWRLDGGLTAELQGLSSRVSTLDTLGSYRLQLQGGGAGGQAATLQLSTIDGALRLSGSGQWAGPTLRFQGEATAAPGAESALDNLLNIIGRREGARSLISIG